MTFRKKRRQGSKGQVPHTKILGNIANPHQTKRIGLVNNLKFEHLEKLKSTFQRISQKFAKPNGFSPLAKGQTSKLIVSCSPNSHLE